MQEAITKALHKALEEIGISEAAFVVEHPTDKNTGADYFSNVALVVSKQLQKNPREIADELATSLGGEIENVEKIEVAGPGFLNFYAKRSFFTNKIKSILEAGEDWGKNENLIGQTVMVEYTSPNLFKPLHVGNLVGNIIGESITRLFEFAGAHVKRINYPSDIGLTVAKAVWGLKRTGGNPEDILALGEAYRLGNEAYESDEVVKEEIVAVNQALYAGSDDELMTLRAKGIETSKKQLDAICKMLGTEFDTVIYESEAAPKGTELVKENIGKVFEESDGAIVYPEEKSGLHTRVFLNSKGLPTYEAKDLGNFSKKRELYPDWTVSIIVTGNEQTEYFKVLYAALREIYEDARANSLEHIPTGFLTLTTGKMSSRKGNVLTGESLLADMEEAAREKASETRADNIETLTKQVAVAALKYQILRQAMGSNIVFDKEKALSFEGDSGPYLQYTYARIGSVLEKAAVAGVVPDASLPPKNMFDIERLVYQFDEVVEAALVERSPHKVTGYLVELASGFNSFYAKERIADANDEYALYKAAVAKTVQQTLKNGLWLLGIEVPEKM